MEYKRFISYMYIYLDGEKNKNVGYVKVEVKNEICKITINARCDKLINKDVEIKLFYSNKEKEYQVYLIPIKKQMCKTNLCECIEKTDVNNMFKSGIVLNDISGVLIRISDTDYIATQWDDKDIVIKKLLRNNVYTKEKIIEQEAKKVEEIIEHEEKKQDIKILKQEEKKQDIKIIEHEEKKQDMKTLEQEEKKQNIKTLEHKEKKQDMKIIEQEEKKQEKTIEKVKQENKKIIESEIKARTIKQENKEKVNTNEKKEDIKTEINIESIDTMYNKEKKDAHKEKMIRSFIENENIISAQNLNVMRSDLQKNNKKEEEVINSIADRIFEKYPGMYPFDDDEIIDCVKLEPQDIGIFPMDKWILANNSFLLHGYYTYRHLIFARKRTDINPEYILGVPGIYRDRERFMASMFGFSKFKGIRGSTNSMGDFGYWYVLIKL